MARGGGTGPRNKKKRSDAPSTTTQNGPAATTTTNGPAETTDLKQIADTKANKSVKNRQKKEETPPTNHIDEEGREEVKVNAKLQPTSEQLRLAQITQDSTLDPLRKVKISQVMDITGKSEDVVGIALFDCGWDETKAIELLIEEGGGVGSWEETGKKKKKKQETANRDEKDAGRENEDWDTDNFDPTNNARQSQLQDGDNRDRSRNRAPPRFKRGGGVGMPNSGGRGGDRDGGGVDQQWKHRELQENERNFAEGSGRGRGGGGVGRGGARSRGGGTIGSGMPPRQRGRGGGPRQFSGGPERGGGGGGGAGGLAGGPGGLSAVGGSVGTADAGPFGQMDTWNPVGEEGGGAANSSAGGSRRGKISSRDAFDNAGNWGDDFPAAEDWDNDEYTGSLSDTKVFTPSGAGGLTKSAVGDPVLGQQHSGTAALGQQQVAVGGGGGGGGGANNSLSGAAYGQPMDLASILQQQKPASAAPGGPTAAALSQYNQAATQDLKSAIGIGAPGGGGGNSIIKPVVGELGAVYGSSALSYSSGNVSSQFSTAVSSGGGGVNSSSFGSAVPGSAFSPIKPAAVTNGTPGSKALPRARLPPPSKIPSSAVEMPGDSLSNLDVQFGGLDLQFGAAGSDSGLGGGGFDFGGGSASMGGGSNVSGLKNNSGSVLGSSSAKGDHLESKFSSIPAPSSAEKSLETGSSYKSSSMQQQQQQQQQPTVKEVNQSLTSALSAAGIKPSGSSSSGDPSLVGYGSSQQQQRSDKSSASYPQRSPGPQQQQQVLDHRTKQSEGLGGYPSNSYSYQPSANKPTSQYGSNSYQSAGSGYERQVSSGYSSSSTNGLGSSASSYGGGSGSSGYNSANATPSSSNYNAGSAGSGLSNSGYNSSYNASSSSSNYSPYNNSGNSNSYSSGKANNSGSGYSSSSQQQQQQQFANSETTTTTTSSSAGKYESTNVSNSSSNTGTSSGGGGGGYAVSSSGGSYGLGGGGGGTSAVNSRSSGGVAAGSGSNKMLPNLPPGVANVIPQYMIGGGAGAGGFPAYLTGLQQPMYGYTGVGAGLGGQQLEDLAALQRNTLASLPQLTSAYYDPSSQFGSAGSSLSNQRQESASAYSDSSKFGQSTDSTSSPVPSTVSAQPTPFNALASTFAAAGPTQHPTLPPGYAYFYGGMAPQLQAAYGGVGGTGVYPAAHPGLAVPTASGATATTQFPKQGYASSYNNYESMPLGQNSSDYGKSNYGSQNNQGKGSNTTTAAQWYSGGTGLW